VQVVLDVRQLLRPERPLEDVETAAGVGVDDLGMEVAAGREADGTPVAQGKGAFFARQQVVLHGLFLDSVVYAVHGCALRRSDWRPAKILTIGPTEAATFPGHAAFVEV
jgi:hypothetical protein